MKDVAAVESPVLLLVELAVLEKVALIGSSVLPLLRAKDELRILVKVPVALTVLVRTVVLSAAELDKGVYVGSGSEEYDW